MYFDKYSKCCALIVYTVTFLTKKKSQSVCLWYWTLGIPIFAVCRFQKVLEGIDRRNGMTDSQAVKGWSVRL